MENRAYALAAGLFTLMLGAGVVAAALWFSGEALSTTRYTLVSRHPVSGLNAQAPVRYRGVAVGKVDSIRFDPENPRLIMVGISILSDIPLTRGSYAQLGSQGVTGLSYVILDDDGSNPARFAESDETRRIEFKQSFIDNMSESGQDMINNFNQVAKRINVLLDDANQKQLMTTLRNLDQTSTRFAALARSMETAINTLDPTLKMLPAIAQDTGATLKRADGLMANVSQRLDTFERGARSVEQLGASATALTESIYGETLPRINSLLDDVQRSSRRIERLVNDINDQPHSMVFGRNPLPPGPGEPGHDASKGGRK